MSLSNIESIFKIAIISTSLVLGGQLYAADMHGPIPPIPGLNVPLDAKPAVKHKKKQKKKKKHKKNKNKKNKGHKHIILSPEKKAEKTIEDCRKLLATPAPEKEAKRKARKRKRCEELMAKEGIPMAAPDSATVPATDTVAVTPSEGQAPATPPVSESAPETPAPEATVPAEGEVLTTEAAPVEEAAQ